jgi:hypothetical protein
VNLDAIIGSLQDLAVERGEFGAGDCVPIIEAGVKRVVQELLDALESTTWSSGCWCSGKDPRGHSVTCAGRMAAMSGAGRPLVIVPRKRRGSK